MKLITIEQAVKLILNLEYIPEYEPLLEITDMIAEDAQEEYQYDASPHNKLRLEICNARHITAQLLFDHIKNEMSLDNSTLKTDSTHSQIVLESFVDWAFKQYGVDIIIPKSPPEFAWIDVKIKIYKDFKIGLFIKGKLNKYSHFQDIGLMGKRKKVPNNLGIILIGLSQKQKFPHPTLEDHHKTAISKLRHYLRKFSGISADPFHSFNEGDGWIPCFELIDDRRNADEREKNNAVKIEYDDESKYSDNDNHSKIHDEAIYDDDSYGDPVPLDFEYEDDAAGRWLKDNY